MMYALFSATAFLDCVSGHGAMQKPLNWHDGETLFGLKHSYQGQAGCQADRVHSGNLFTPGSLCAAMWFTNFTHIEGEPTLPKDMRTYGTYSKQDGIPIFNPDFTINPWYKPGSAPMWSPCGIAGGNPKGCEKGYDCPGGGYGFGLDAREYKFKNVPVTEWQAGSVVEVGFGINANHGGGYAYRLCKKQLGMKYTDYLTEECFQAGHLSLYGDSQFIQYDENWEFRTQIKAKRTRIGTTPKGSQWTRFPIPACAGINGIYTTYGSSGDLVLDGLCKNATDTQFPPPADKFGSHPHLYGYGVDYANGNGPSLNFSVVDRLMVPKELEGDYVLSWRWDCEQTPQIWSQCADVRITK